MAKIDVIPEGTEKITDKNIDIIINNFYLEFNNDLKGDNEYSFDLSEIKWIANQELLILKGIFKYLYDLGVKFRINFFKNGSSAHYVKKNAETITWLWDHSKIYSFANEHEILDYFDLSKANIDGFYKRFHLEKYKSYDQEEITPFLCLDYLNKYEDSDLGDMINKIFEYDKVIQEKLESKNCVLPFKNNTLSYLITKELYENFLDHFKESLFKENDSQYSFMSIALINEFNETIYSSEQIQSFLKRNYYEEHFEEDGINSFVFDKKKERFLNQPKLSYSFLDFGTGIPSTLRKNYLKSIGKSQKPKEISNTEFESNILQFSFRHDSSQHEILERYRDNILIPRGLFDLISIVKRFEGFLVARSGFGKVAFDFSNGKNFDDSIIFFGDKEIETYFPGTLITIHLTEPDTKNSFNYLPIKPIETLDDYSFKIDRIDHILLSDIENKLKEKEPSKKHLYNELFKILINEFSKSSERRLIYVDFDEFQADERIRRKIIHFLSSDYKVNYYNNVIVLNPPPIEYLKTIQNEYRILNQVVKNLVLHPTPFIYLDYKTNELDIYWLGVFHESDIKTLNEVLLNSSLTSNDFTDPSNVTGNINYFDSLGNLKSLIEEKEIRSIVSSKINSFKEQRIDRLINKCLKKSTNEYFLCNGNYYQKQFIQIYDALIREEDCDLLSSLLFEKLKIKDSNYRILTISPNSQRIATSLVRQGLLNQSKLISLYSFEQLKKINDKDIEIKKYDEIILLCDVLSTGYLAHKVNKTLNNFGANLKKIGVLVDTRDPHFLYKEINHDLLRNNIISLFRYRIIRYNRSDILNSIISDKKKIIRINPFTQTPISASSNESNRQETVLFENEEFVTFIREVHLKIGYYKFNNLIHPYFFDMDKLLSETKTSRRLLYKLFNKIDIKLRNSIDLIFYPKDSGVNSLDFDFLKNEVLKNQKIKFYELERYQVHDGWKFPHPPKVLSKLTKQKTVLILDDGSCSGESIIQMIDEIAFYEVQKIVVLSIIGRINDHKREFFSRISSLRGKDSADIDIRIFFGSHWFINTYYLQDSPVTTEKRWLTKVLDIQNLPWSIRKIANLIVEELKNKDVKIDGNNKYVIKTRDGKYFVSELIQKRDLVGKVTSYRFYKEYFKPFDKILSHYENPKGKTTKDRFKEIEEICAVFGHEPYLFDAFRKILPDFSDTLREFILALLIRNPNNGPIITKEELFYQWSNKDFIHLLFVFFKDEELVNLLDSKNLILLLKHLSSNKSDIPYLFYKILFYFPLEQSGLALKPFTGEIIKNLLTINDSTVNTKIYKQIRVFISFVSTLPVNEDNYFPHLNKIRGNYYKLHNIDNHNDFVNKALAQFEPSLNTIYGQIYKKKLPSESVSEEIHTVHSSWRVISKFISDLLSFSITYPYFYLIPDHYNELENKREEGEELNLFDNSLRNIFGELTHLILNEKFSEHERIKNLINYINTEFISKSCVYTNIFSKVTTPNFLSNLDENFIKQLNSDFEFKLINKPKEDFTVYIPNYYVDKLIIGELKENIMRWANNKKPIVIEFEFSKDKILIEITNSIKKTTDNHGGGRGIERLLKLNDFPQNLAGFEYHTPKKDKFVQQLTFKTG